MLFVKTPGVLRDREAEHRSNAAGFGRTKRAHYGVGEQVGGEAFALPAPIDRKSPKKNDRRRIRHVALDFAGCDRMQHGTGGEAMVAADATIQTRFAPAALYC